MKEDILLDQLTTCWHMTTDEKIKQDAYKEIYRIIQDYSRLVSVLRKIVREEIVTTLESSLDAWEHICD